ncbi:hypothetical protein GA830_06180 [Mesorhizobium sp. NBSH29]|uniref:V4R domain-containing protein n=1 Tax=Mesorhizobium sp. NBSH29 TaxID=2654249 RepID=UPI001896467A|nr:V4R domain-containing protein [Mesorhizobium sp. NBSH29]QPC86370.1 hypothetical protein GA830_06180 [Mesorhizobium sp. NBSH29]
MTKVPFRDRLVFENDTGEIQDEGRRYMLVRPEALMGIFRLLGDDLRAEALDALAASVVEMGGKSARAYRDDGPGDPESLLSTVAITAPDLGWGIWEFSLNPAKLHLNVRNSPFAMGYGASVHPVCHAISGMATAVARLALNREDLVAVETACSACGAPACTFEANLE